MVNLSDLPHFVAFGIFVILIVYILFGKPAPEIVASGVAGGLITEIVDYLNTRTISRLTKPEKDVIETIKKKGVKIEYDDFLTQSKLIIGQYTGDDLLKSLIDKGFIKDKRENGKRLVILRYRAKVFL